MGHAGVMRHARFFRPRPNEWLLPAATA